MMDALTPQQVVAYARRFGLESKLEPFLSLALGAADLTLLDMTSALFGVSKRRRAHAADSILKISDREGNLLEESRPIRRMRSEPHTAYVMTSLLRGWYSVERQVSAATWDGRWAGKTGTTDDYGDAWFIGFDPDITVGVWVGMTSGSRSATTRPAPSPRCRSGSSSCAPTSGRATEEPARIHAAREHRLCAGQCRERRDRRGRRHGHQRSIHLRDATGHGVSALIFSSHRKDAKAQRILTESVLARRGPGQGFTAPLSLLAARRAFPPPIGCPSVAERLNRRPA
jgi:membrane peptidoglycan carboxypeptidase